eukprot:GHVQ01033539.1.p1 GENE.GHVQ01033539.1~~GHVQ01033539.1.p1  ORF type:complete len:143 (-),score=21.19 GHVQ01033539.1:56-484(-)
MCVCVCVCACVCASSIYPLYVCYQPCIPPQSQTLPDINHTAKFTVNIIPVPILSTSGTPTTTATTTATTTDTTGITTTTTKPRLSYTRPSPTPPSSSRMNSPPDSPSSHSLSVGYSSPAQQPSALTPRQSAQGLAVETSQAS